MQEICIEKNDSGQRLDKYLKKYLKEAGSGFIYKMLRKKNITLNAGKADGTELIKENDVIRFFFSEETFDKMRGKLSAPADSVMLWGGEEPAVIYEDEHILIVDKPVGMLSQSDKSGVLSVNDWLAYHLKDDKKLSEGFSPSVCNRLDRNTSGLVLCAKTYAASRYLSGIIKDHSLRKFYLALAEGSMNGSRILEGLWQKDEKNNKVSIKPLSKGEMSGKMAGVYVKTAYRVLENTGKYTRLEVELFTGKSHQIRAHLAAIGHPLAGDIKYGGHPYKGRRQELRAYKLCFPETTGDFSYLSGREFIADQTDKER